MAYSFLTTDVQSQEEPRVAPQSQRQENGPPKQKPISEYGRLVIDGEAFVKAGEYNKGIDSFTRALALGARSAFSESSTLTYRAGAYLKSGRIDDALRDHDQAVRLDPNVFTLWARAETLRYAKRFQESLADYDAVIAMSPNDAEVLRGRGIALARLGRQEEAKAALDKAVALEPSVDNRLARAAYFLTQKNHDAAFADYSAILSDSPDDRGGRMGRAQIYMLREQLDLALADYEAVLLAHGPYREAFQGRGYVFERQGRLDLARADYERALQLDLDNAWLKRAIERVSE